MIGVVCRGINRHTMSFPVMNGGNENEGLKGTDSKLESLRRGADEGYR